MPPAPKPFREPRVEIGSGLAMLAETGVYVESSSGLRTKEQAQARRTHGQFLRALRQEAGLTQEELARHIGLTPAHYARLERGELPIQAQTHYAVTTIVWKEMN